MRLITCTSWDHARREAQAWLVSDTKFLILFGNPGTGKTTLVADLAYPPVPTRQHRDVTMHWQDSPWYPSTEPHIYRLVCVDDVKAGIKGKFASSGAEVLGSVIDDVEAGKTNRLILTTNLDGRAMGELLDPGARDRLKGHGWWIQFNFSSFRGSVAEKKGPVRQTVGVSPVEAYKLYRHVDGGFIRLVGCNSVAKKWCVKRFTSQHPTGFNMELTSDELKQYVSEAFLPDPPGDTPAKRAVARTVAMKRELGAMDGFWEGLGAMAGNLCFYLPKPLIDAYAEADPDGWAEFQYRLEQRQGAT